MTVPANPYRYDWTDQWAGHRRRYTVEMLRLADRATPGSPTPGVQGWGFPFTGLYHRQVYRRALRAAPGRRRRPRRRRRPAAPGRRAIVRAALEVDSAFIGRRPGLPRAAGRRSAA